MSLRTNPARAALAYLFAAPPMGSAWGCPNWAHAAGTVFQIVPQRLQHASLALQ